jgi:3-dehydrosphinganine reductase
VARREALLKDAAAEVSEKFQERGQRVFTYSADVADAARAKAAVDACARELGVPDLVITSAGVAVPGYFGDIPIEAFETSMAVNYFGSLYVMRAALPAMRARKSGRIVFISSGAAFLGLFGYSTYCPSKFAVRGLAETLRAELRNDNIGVTIAYPPDTETPMLEEENKIKPEETKLITGLVKAWSADAVATVIMRGIERGIFAITPGATLTMMNRAPGMVNPILSWYADKLADSVRKKRSA